MPIISTQSIGGRHIWYDEYNSIIVKPEPSEIENSIQLCFDLLRTERFEPYRIRQKHIIKSKWFREKFCKLLTILINKPLEECRTLFTERFEDQMINYLLF